MREMLMFEINRSSGLNLAKELARTQDLLNSRPRKTNMRLRVRSYEKKSTLR